MRVCGGKAKGRKLAMVPGSGTRPILDRVRQALFDTLRPDLDQATVLDLFAGTGSVGIEALSQGADHCTFTDTNHAACETTRKNLAATGLTNNARVLKQDAFMFLRRCELQYDLIYIDPPRYQELWQKILITIDQKPKLIFSGGWIIVEIDPREYNQLPLANLTEIRQKRYGNTLLVFYKRKDESSAA